MNAATHKKTGDEVAGLTNRDFAARLIQLQIASSESLSRLFAALANEKSEVERIEIAKTIEEVVFPESLDGFVDDDDESEMIAAREQVNRYRKSLGRVIRNHREARHLSQDQLAEQAGMPQSHISCLENGKHAPTYVTIERLAKAFNVAPSQLDPGFSDDE